MGIGNRRLNIPAQAEVQRQSRVHPEIVLQIDCVIPIIVDLRRWRILIHRGGQAQNEISRGVPCATRSICRVESERAVVIQQRVMNHFFKRRLAADA